MNNVELIYIGENFYRESETSMSSIYTVDGKRYDWGFVDSALQQGKTVNIRPATTLELNHYEAELNRIRRKREETVWQRVNIRYSDFMKKLTTSVPCDSIQIDEALDLFKNGKGIVVQVYVGMACILAETSAAHNRQRSFAFVGFGNRFGKYNDINFRTDGPTVTEAFDNFVGRLKKDIKESEGRENKADYYYFDSLQSFAAAITKYGWK